MISRRTFVNGLAAGVAGSALASTAKSYAQILGANDRLNFAINGLNGRGYAHLSALKSNSKTARVAYCCDVDTKILARFAGAAEKALGYAPKAEQDFRRMLDSKDVDAITIATPDHWHTPWQFWDSRRESTSTSKSHQARTPAKASSSSPRRRNTKSASR